MESLKTSCWFCQQVLLFLMFTLLYLNCNVVRCNFWRHILNRILWGNLLSLCRYKIDSIREIGCKSIITTTNLAFNDFIGIIKSFNLSFQRILPYEIILIHLIQISATTSHMAFELWVMILYLEINIHVSV